MLFARDTKLKLRQQQQGFILVVCKTCFKNQLQHGVARGPQGIEQDGREAPKYSRGTEDYCFKGEVQHKTQ